MYKFAQSLQEMRGFFCLGKVANTSVLHFIYGTVLFIFI